MNAHDIIDRLDLQPHPEGGWFRETFRSTHTVVRQSDGATRDSLTCIDFLLDAGSGSRWHKVLSDEVWHFSDGSDLQLAMISPDGREQRVLRLGRPSAGQPHTATVPAGWWQAARPTGDWTLCTCTVGPGFDFADFSFHSDGDPIPGTIPKGWSDLI